MKIKKSGLLALMLIGTSPMVSAQIPFVNMDGAFTGESNFNAVVFLGSSALQNPGQFGPLLGLGTSVLGSVSPTYKVIENNGPLAAPEFLLNGGTLLSPHLTSIPGLPLVNQPLPGLAE